jgi:hypothetical protein
MTLNVKENRDKKRRSKERLLERNLIRAIADQELFRG